MVLVGDGRLDLDAPVRRWLPGAATHRHRAPAARPRRRVRRARRVLPRPARRAASPIRAPSWSDRAAREPRRPAGRRRGVQRPRLHHARRDPRARGRRAARGRVRRARRRAARARRARSPGRTPLAGAVATELDDARPRCCRSACHDENALLRRRRRAATPGCSRTIGDVARFAAAIVDTAAGTPRGRLRPDVVHAVRDRSAPVPGRHLAARLGHAVGDAGRLARRRSLAAHRRASVTRGFTGTSLWLDLPRRRWVALLTNRVHPTRHAGSAEAIKALRRAVHDAVLDRLDGA